MGKILFSAIMGALAGLLAWGVMEPFAPSAFTDPAWAGWQTGYSLLLGASIGGVLGGLLGYQQGSRLHLFRGLALGILLGAIGGSVGMRLGGSVAQALFGDILGRIDAGSMDMIQRILARTVLITILGAALGAVVGASTLSRKQILLGLIGGALGGAVGGITFDFLGSATADISKALRGGDETGIVGRALTSVVIGGGIGLFTSFLRQATKSAWLRLRLGRNENKEWIVDRAQTFIGRNENADVPLFGDLTVIPNHACIVRQGASVYVLMDGGSPVGTLLNGQRVTQAPLFPGAVIQVGSFALEFMMKDGVIPIRPAEQMHGLIPVQAPIAQAPVPAPVPVQAQSFAIIALSGPITGQRFAIPNPIEIGREATGLALRFDTVASRRHASMVPAIGGLLLTDLGSTNGTFVNDQRVQTTTVRPGDIVRIGSTTFRVE